VSYNTGQELLSQIGAAPGTATGSITAIYSYDIYDGTSMATLHVSAASVLAFQENASLTAGNVRTVLQNSAQDLGAAGWDQFYGYGMVRADQIVIKARTFPS